MAYVLGYLYADGSMEDASYLRGKYVRVTSIDRQLIELTKRALSSQHKIVIIPPHKPTVKTRFFLRIGNHKIYNDLITLGLYPKKSLTIKFPKVPEEMLADFVRGYFDGDGHVGMEVKGDAFKKLKVVFVSGSYIFLQDLAANLNKQLKLRINKVYKGNKSFQLAYSTEDAVKIFKFIYPKANKLFLLRKFEVFKSFFQRYNKWGDSEVIRILNGQVAKR